MISNYLKTALRSLLRNKIFSFINIFGLAIGLAASLMIAMWVFDELSYDRFNENADRIYRVERDIFYQGQSFLAPVTGGIYGPTFLNNFPDVVNMTRIDPEEVSLENSSGRRFTEQVIFADTGFLQMYTFPLQQGNPKTALKEPRSLILSPVAAKKFFGDTDALNKTLKVEWGDEMVDFRITGIFEEIPKNKHFDFEIVGSFASLENIYSQDQLTSWISNYLYTYVMVREDADMERLKDQMDVLARETILPVYTGFFNAGEESDGSLKLLIRPITDIHLRSGLMWDIKVQGDLMTVYIFSVVALLILLIASFNFMSLSSALAGTRALEVGLRKTLGSTRGQLIRQFIGESVLITLISVVIAFLLIQIALPHFNDLTGKSLSMQIFLQPYKLLILLLIVAGTGVLSGLYPAMYLSSFRPIAVLKSRFQQSGSTFSFRQVLVVLQFAISIALILGTFTALKQMNYMQNKPLGYNKENLMILPVESTTVSKHYDVFRDDLTGNPMIRTVSASQRVPAERAYSDTGWETDKLEEMFLSIFFTIDYDFFKTYEIEMVAGRAFDEQYATDRINKVVINETAARKLGYTDMKDAIGDKYEVQWLKEEMGYEEEGKIIGVMKDFHFKSMKNKIEPLTLLLHEDWMNRITIRYQEGKEKETIAYVEGIWKKHFPDIDFDFAFIDDYLTTYYRAEQKLQIILLVFTILAIVIACMGLFGLAMFIAQQKVKEIGVRKAMGASIGSIVFMLTRTFTKWVVLANVIAWPVAWYFLNKWLDNFQYRTEINIWLFVLAGLLALAIAVLTVAHRSYSAASKNPVDALRYE
ncbi:MAG: ABC transporter permease [Bacteroidales bacterium]